MTLDGTPWFVVRDVLNVLGIKYTGNGLSNMDQNHVCDFKIPGQRGRPNKLVNEAGLYRLVLRSDKKEAKAFQDWVTGTVLPAIRKDGAYVMGEERLAAGNCPADRPDKGTIPRAGKPSAKRS
ncbi:BRO family, N-terminal domain [Paracoccus halophilus]|uniref:BRO family, N-terminal domain n=1 Tax=Paracoccus halophilus TaxID=376733 RepID=A0A1I0SQT9_9RHOB|nr:BRO family protein [Paracoccus halophilus]SFA41793.1 BRO family, N-terminal domain [Paracoccus halophilus]